MILLDETFIPLLTLAECCSFIFIFMFYLHDTLPKFNMEPYNCTLDWKPSFLAWSEINHDDTAGNKALFFLLLSEVLIVVAVAKGRPSNDFFRSR